MSLPSVLQLQPLGGIQRREVVEEDFVSGLVRVLEVDGFDFDQGEVAFSILRRTHLSRHRVARAQVEFTNLRGRDVDVVRAWQIVVVRGSEKSETVRKSFKNAFTENEAALLGLRLQDLENQFLLPHSGSSLNVEVFGNLRQRGNVHFLQLCNVHGGGAFWAIRSNEFF